MTRGGQIPRGQPAAAVPNDQIELGKEPPPGRFFDDPLGPLPIDRPSGQSPTGNVLGERRHRGGGDATSVDLTGRRVVGFRRDRRAESSGGSLRVVQTDLLRRRPVTDD